jgi:hypothetical protein
MILKRGQQVGLFFLCGTGTASAVEFHFNDNAYDVPGKIFLEMVVHLFYGCLARIML